MDTPKPPTWLDDLDAAGAIADQLDTLSTLLANQVPNAVVDTEGLAQILHELSINLTTQLRSLHTALTAPDIWPPANPADGGGARDD